jgi:CheY-like chemotaxis protein
VRQLGAPPPVLGNDGKLAQVVLNLLINAAQAIDEGDAAGNTIRVSTRQEGAEAVIEVEDTGAGISGADLQRLFDPFFSAKEGGTGLGLAICRDIVAAHGGTIEAQSRVDQGSRFVINLPLAPQAETSEAPLAEVPAAPMPEQRGRVLVVDDEPHIGKAIKRMLAEEHDVVLATSGAAARALLEQDLRFDVIISDLMMPDVTGMDLFAWVSDHAPHLAERIVFVTGSAYTQTARAFFDRVSNKRLEKPFDPQALRACLRDLVRGTPEP